jgi:Trp operon repressor
MPRTAHLQKKRIKRVRVPKEILAELIKRELSVRGLARKYGVSDAVISNILGGFPYKHSDRGKWAEIKEQLLKDYPWLREYLTRS